MDYLAGLLIGWGLGSIIATPTVGMAFLATVVGGAMIVGPIIGIANEKNPSAILVVFAIFVCPLIGVFFITVPWLGIWLGTYSGS